MTNKLGSEFADGDALPAADLNDTFEASSPVGTVVAFLKDYSNTPTLPDGWAECNGQTLSDADSPYDGQALPNLNGNNRFLRGNSSSGGSGGADQVQLSVNDIPSHSHDFYTWEWDNDYGNEGTPPGGTDNWGNSGNYNNAVKSTGGDGSHENKPPYYDVVWIIKVK